MEKRMSRSKWDDMKYQIGQTFARSAHTGGSADVEVETVSGTPQYIPRKKSSNDNKPLYLGLLLVLAIGLGFVVVNNMNKGSQQPSQQTVQVQPPQLYPSDPHYQRPQVQQTQPQSQRYPDYYLYNGMMRLREDVANLQESNEVLKTRVQLLGASHNNNWHVYRYGLEKKGLVFFERDWRLNQKPPHIRAAEQEQADQFFSSWATD
jgi:hypothetical protein